MQQYARYIGALVLLISVQFTLGDIHSSEVRKIHSLLGEEWSSLTRLASVLLFFSSVALIEAHNELYESQTTEWNNAVVIALKTALYICSFFAQFWWIVTIVISGSVLSGEGVWSFVILVLIALRITGERALFWTLLSLRKKKYI